MKIVLAIGAPGAGHDEVFAMLGEAGVAAALPTEAGHAPKALGSMLMKAGDVQSDLSRPPEQLRLDKNSQALALDLIAANAQKPLWGWSDHQTAWLMDFWQELPAPVHLLLVYSTPPEFLANTLGDFPELDRTAVDATLRAWQCWHTALLRYHLRNRHCTALVHAGAALANPRALVEMLARSWDITGLSVPGKRTDTARHSLLACVADGAIPSNHEVHRLAEQIENSAALPWSEADDTILRARMGWAAAGALLAGCRSATEALAALREKSVSDHASLEKQQATSARAQNDADAARRQLQQLTARTEAAHLEWKQEKTLLVQQLEQVQEELRRYFAKYQDVKQTKASPLADYWICNQPEVVALDLRTPVQAQNWYDAEPDGRWTGPGRLSTVQFPPLRKGSYLIELEVLDAMDPDILREAEVEIAGTKYSLSIEHLAPGEQWPAIARCVVSVPAADPSAAVPLRIHLPRTISPAASGSPDSRMLGLRIQQIRLIELAGEE